MAESPPAGVAFGLATSLGTMESDKDSFLTRTNAGLGVNCVIAAATREALVEEVAVAEPLDAVLSAAMY